MLAGLRCQVSGLQLRGCLQRTHFTLSSSGLEPKKTAHLCMYNIQTSLLTFSFRSVMCKCSPDPTRSREYPRCATHRQS